MPPSDDLREILSSNFNSSISTLLACALRQELCVPKTSSVLIGQPNRLNVSGDGRAALLHREPVSFAIQVEEPT